MDRLLNYIFVVAPIQTFVIYIASYTVLYSVYHAWLFLPPYSFGDNDLCMYFLHFPKQVLTNKE